MVTCSRYLFLTIIMSGSPLVPLFKLDAVEIAGGTVAFKGKADHRYYVQCQARRKQGTVAFIDIMLARDEPFEGRVWITVTSERVPDVLLPWPTLSLANRGTHCVDDDEMTVSQVFNC